MLHFLVDLVAVQGEKNMKNSVWSLSADNGKNDNNGAFMTSE